MTTTTRRPATAEEHTVEARRLLNLVRPTGLTPAELTETYAYESPANILAAAQAHATLALVEEQRTANLIAADAADLLVSPHEVGTPEHKTYWQQHATALNERLAVQR